MKRHERVRRNRIPPKCGFGRKLPDQRSGHYTYERKMVVSEADGLLVEPENADRNPEWKP